MVILQISSHLNIGGVTSYTLSLSQGLSRLGHRVIVASDGGQLEPQVNAFGLTHWLVPLHTSNELSPQVFFALRQLGKHLERERADIIHAHTRVAQVVAAQLSRSLKIPYVTTWHGFFNPNLGRRLWPCTGQRTIAISEAVRQDLLETFGVALARVRLVPNGVDVAHFSRIPDAAVLNDYRARWNLPANQPVIGGLGRLASGGVKGFDLFLMAARILRSRIPEFHVLIIGDGPRRKFLEGKIKQLGLRNNTHLVGAMADVRIPLALMDVFVFTSRWKEGFGLALIEAMAAGKPVVAARMGATPYIVEHGQSGLLVNPESPSALAEGIAKLLEDPLTASRFGAQAQECVRQRFSLDHMVHQVEAVYKELIG